MTELSKLMTAEEVAALLSVHPETIRRAVRNRKLAHYRFAGCIRIAQDQLDAYLAASLRPALAHVSADEIRAEETSPVVDFQRSRRFARALNRGAER